jgi:hypothetical protein
MNRIIKISLVSLSMFISVLAEDINVSNTNNSNNKNEKIMINGESLLIKENDLINKKELDERVIENFSNNKKQPYSNKLLKFNSKKIKEDMKVEENKKDIKKQNEEIEVRKELKISTEVEKEKSYTLKDVWRENKEMNKNSTSLIINFNKGENKNENKK